MSDIKPGSHDDPFSDIHSIAHRLRRWRSAAGLSQEQLEAATIGNARERYGERGVGVSQKTISDIESGRVVRPQDGTLEKLADVFAEAVDVNPETVYRDLQQARDSQPSATVSPFAYRLDNLLQGHDPDWRVFLEEAILDFYFSMQRARQHAADARRSMKKKLRGK
jgi:transcriptional regulator with XRE-family HTH domain